MDPLDDFEFKPLTDGLGFHKKKSDAPATVKNEPAQRREAFSTSPEASSPSTAFSNLSTPLPRKKNERARVIPTIEDEISPGNSAVDEILQTLSKNRDLDFVKHEKTSKTTAALSTTKAAPTAKAAVASNTQLESSTPSFMAAILDSMLIIAASLMCLIVMLTITKVDLLANINKPDSEGMIYLSTAALFLSVTFIYMLVHRVFMGATPGEWAFDQQVGADDEIGQPLYTLKVMGRIVLNMATGFVLLPLLSMVFGRDLAGAATGTSLVKKV